ncbi:MAG: hypothetical protein HOC71_09785 [Candidatus Latescibacteria bacterium]|jgi:hypothetical protein|nr:hypothetical protein [Candidatus Latescibacterota bacterium]
MSVLMFEEKNSPEFEKVEILDSSPDVRFLPDFKDELRIDPARYPVVGTRHYLELRSTLDLLKGHGYQPKIFCEALTEDEKSVFSVQSDMWDWFVTQVNSQNYRFIPKDLLVGVGALVENNNEIKGVAIAKPKPREEKTEVVAHEFLHEVNTLKKIAGFFLLLIPSALEMTTNSFNVANENAKSVHLKALPDPVLLVKVGNFWVEVGRWE